MKNLFPVLMILGTIASLLVTTALAAPAALLTPTAELGQLKVCKVAGSGVTEGKLFEFRVNGSDYSVPAGPSDRNGFCILAGQYPVNSEVMIEEVIPDGYYVSRIEVKPDHTVHKDIHRGIVTVQIVSGVMETIFTNKKDTGTPTPTRTPTSIYTSTPRPTKTASSTPGCDPNCAPTSTPVPKGRLQICKEAEDSGVIGSFTFRFDTRSRTVPVGACAGLISVNAGTLTITEDAQVGYEVADIYTIPADRLISRDLRSGVATVRIEEGAAASQTIVIFRNRGLPPPTFTPTSVTPTPVCAPPDEPVVIYADFTKVPEGESVEGLDTVADYLNIDAKGTAVRLTQATRPMYFAPNGSGGSPNGGLAEGGGFSDQDAQTARQPHSYTFTFAQGISVKNFSLHMLDYGDANPSLTAAHMVTMTAYDASGQLIASQELSYLTPPVASPRSSDLYGDLYFTGDAVTAFPGQPGNWTWNVSGDNIARVVLEFGEEGYDPNIAFDNLSFTVCKTSSCQWISADYSGVNPGGSVQGPGKVADHLDIVAKGMAKRLAALQLPLSYESPNQAGSDLGIINGGLVAGGGFSELIPQNDLHPLLYTFTFAPGVSITNFSLHMLDYGDWNPTLSTNHYVSMTAYDVNNTMVSKQELSYTTPPVESPRNSSSYGDLFFTGDALSAFLGQPGNWIWNVSGNGIAKVVLEFGEGYDPNLAFDLLSFTTECAAGCPPVTVFADFNSVPIGQSVEGMGTVAPFLNIDANNGTALHVAQAVLPAVYQAPNGRANINGGLGLEGGFSDLDTQAARDPHLYTFIFDEPITNFFLHMLDFGDWNPERKTSHKAMMIAFDVNDKVVSKQELNYTTDAVVDPRSSDLYGNLYITGDAQSAFRGQPGNWVWNVAGNGIVRVELRFGYEVDGDMDNGYDPNVAFGSLSFVSCR